MFKIGDSVKFKKTSLDSGMIDATEEDVFTVLYVAQGHVMLTEMGSWWSVGHFEHVKEKEIMEEKYIPKVGDKVVGFKFEDNQGLNLAWTTRMDKYVGQEGFVSGVEDVYFEIQFEDDWWDYPLSLAHLAKIEETKEDQKIKWEIGQEVWCCAYGEGVVESVSLIDDEIHVGFNRFNNSFNYDVNGIVYGGTNRTLFFSEPKIIAEKFPPKKPFVPTLKRGDVVAVKWADTIQILILEQETENQVKGNCGQVWDKYPDVHFYKLGEEIKFN